MNWKYITPEVISSGKFVARDVEQYNEVQEYNKQMTAKQMMKYKCKSVHEIYMLLNVIAYLMALCLYLKPFIFKGVGGINIAAALIAGAGYFYLLWRYIIPDFGSNDTVIKVSSSRSYSRGLSSFGGNYTEIRTGASFGTIASFIIGFILVALSVAFLKDKPTINAVVSFAAIVVCTLMMIFYVFVPKRWNIAVSIIGAAALFLVNPVVSVYALMIIVVSVFTDMHERRVRGEEGYPDFTILVVTTDYEGSRKVRSYDDFNRYDGIDDEMESL